MIIKEYNKEGLVYLIQSDFFNNSDVIPITSIRAISQINNPRVEKNDIILIVAYEENIITGYIGILPDKMFIDLKEIKIGWISCWWTDNNKGKTIALELFYKALKIWSHNILITDMIPKTKFIIDKTEEFFIPQQSAGYRCYLRFDLSNILPAKSKLLKRISILLNLIDFLCNIINNIRLKLLKSFLNRQLRKSDITLEYIENIDEEANCYIKNHQNNELICRGKKELEWINTYPWISNTEQAEIEGKKYYFSSYCKFFENHFLKIYRKKELIGFLYTSQRDTQFKIPYLYFEKRNVLIILKAIYRILISNNCSVYTTFNPILSEYLKNNSTPFFYKRKLFNDLAVSVNFKDLNLKNIILQDGDGDCAFT